MEAQREKKGKLYQGHVARHEWSLNYKASTFHPYSVLSRGETIVISVALLYLQSASAALISFAPQTVSSTRSRWD